MWKMLDLVEGTTICDEFMGKVFAIPKGSVPTNAPCQLSTLCSFQSSTGCCVDIAYFRIASFE